MSVRNLLVGLATALVLAALVLLNPTMVPAETRHLIGIGPSRLEAPAQSEGHGAYRFMQHQPGDPNTPVTYDPCKVISIEINPGGVQDEDQAREIVLQAMKGVSMATGLRLKYAGPSTDRPHWSSHTHPVRGRADPSLVTFATSQVVPALKGRVDGVGGSTSVRRHGVTSYVSGQVTLDIAMIDDLLAQPGGADDARAIAMHELSHLVGLAHVDDEGELMNVQNHGQLQFGPGDRQGLAELGKGPCT